MKKAIKVCGILILMIFSFFYTEKIAMYVQDNVPLKKELKSYKMINNISSINAKVMGDEIIPGLNGLTVNVDKSFKKMKTANVFIEKDVIYDEVKPNISVKDYPDKKIVSGNVEKKAVSILVSNKNINLEYLYSNNINYTDIKLNKYCIILNDNSNCNYGKPKVNVNIILNNSNFIKNINSVQNGSIVYLDDNLDKLFIDVLLKHIKFYNLKILHLDDHLSENNHV